jgi:hypothetical protein
MQSSAKALRKLCEAPASWFDVPLDADHQLPTPMACARVMVSASEGGLDVKRPMIQS